MPPVRRPAGHGVHWRRPLSPDSPRPEDPVDAVESPAAPPADLIAVGRVVDAYGLRGWVKIDPFNDPESSVLLRTRRWWLADPRIDRPGAPAGGLRDTPCVVERARTQGGHVVAKPATTNDRDAALSLRGCEIRVSRADFPAGEDGEFYWSDLVGCEVRNPAGERLGAVFAVEDYGAHPILRLRDETSRERMIPFVAAHVIEVDLAGRRILADWALDF